MKKILSGLILLNLLAFLVVPLIVSAQEPMECCRMKRTVTIDTETVEKGKIVGPTTSTYCPLGTTTNASEKWGLFCVINTINAVVDWIFVILVALVVVLVLIGAYFILTAAGAPEQVAKGRNYILYAAIGLLIAFLARAVPALVKVAMGY